MKKIFPAMFAIIAVMALLQPASSVETRAGNDYLLFIPECEEQYESGIKVMVAGIEHNLTFYRPSENITVILYSQGYLEGTKNETTYYRWGYRDGNFYDMEYGKYINLSSSAVFRDKIAFHIGISSKAEGAGRDENGALWHLQIKSGESTITEDDIFVEKMDAGIALRRAEFEFRVEPFSGGRVYPDYNHTFLSINKGNVPLFLTGYYDKMGDIFVTTNMSIVLRPEGQTNSEVEHEVYLKALPWSPQVFSVIEHLRAIPLHVMKTESIDFSQIPGQQVRISVKVVRSGFNIIDIGPAKLQYEKGPKVADYNEVLILRGFLNGNGSARLTFSPSKLVIKGIYYDGVWHNETSYSPVSVDFYLEEDKEEEVKIALWCNKEDVSARISYIIESGGKSGTAYTDIVVGKAPSILVSDEKKEFEINPVSVAIVLGLMGLVGAFLAVYTRRIRNDRERENDKNSEEYRPATRRKKRKKR